MTDGAENIDDGDNGIIPLTTESRQYLGRLQRRHTLSRVFAATASVGATAALALSVAYPEPILQFMSILQTPSSATTPAEAASDLGWMARFLAVAGSSMMFGLAFGAIATPFTRETNNRLSTLWQRQAGLQQEAQAQALREAQETFVMQAVLNRASNPDATLTDRDYDVIALLPEKLQRELPDVVSLPQTLAARARVGGSDTLDRLLREHREAANGGPYKWEKMKGYTDSLLMLPALFVYTIPHLFLADTMSWKKPQAADFELPVMPRPDLYALAEELRQQPAAPAPGA